MILFVLKFITCLLDLCFFFHGCCHLTHLNDVTENDFMLYNPPGGHSYLLHQGASQQLSSKTMRGSSVLTKARLRALRTHMSTCLAEEGRSRTGCKDAPSAVRNFSEAQVPKCLLNTNTVEYTRHYRHLISQMSSGIKMNIQIIVASASCSKNGPNNSLVQPLGIWAS